jgi:hypothetical protein
MRRFYVVSGEHRWGPYHFEHDANARARMSGGIVEPCDEPWSPDDVKKIRSEWWKLVEELEASPQAGEESKG